MRVDNVLNSQSHFLVMYDPLSPRDHFTFLKTDLISLQLTVLEGKFP